MVVVRCQAPPLSNSPSMVAAVAEVEGLSPTELKDSILYDCVGVAALEDAFFEPDVSGRGRVGVGTGEFMVGEYRITVKSNGLGFRVRGYLFH